MKKTVKIMLACLAVIILCWLVIIYQNYKFNSATHTIDFNESISESVGDENIGVQILPRGFGTSDMSSWNYQLAGANEYNGSYVGTIYELTLTNLSEDVISDWGFELTFPGDMMFAEGWNGDFDMHQFVDTDEKEFVFKNSKFVADDLTLDHLENQNVLLIPFHKGDYFTYEPSEASLEVPLGGSDIANNDYTTKIIGFIVYAKDVGLEDNIGFCDGSLNYKLHRSLLKENFFYVIFLLSWIWLVVFIVNVIVYIKLLKVKRQSEMMEEMVHKFEKDDLTSVYSRSAFLHYGQEILDSSSEDMGLAVVSVDNYVFMQHKLGEVIYSEYAKYIADYLKEKFPEDCVGRISRGKFAVLFRNKDGINPDIFVGDAVRTSSPLPDQKLKVGIYAPIDHQYLIERCCDRVVIALDTIKDDYDKSVVYFDDSMESNVFDRHSITAQVNEALNVGQFKVYYQPKNDSKTRGLAGAEALVRWIHPEYGFMNPGRFIPILEENGLITSLDAYVFEQVCRDLKKWQDEGRKTVPVSVNISRRDFYEKDWIEKRVAYAESLGIPTSLLHMEVTESLYTEDTELITSKLKWLREKGYSIELDDFGSGYSTLGLLGKLPVDILKLDITFIRNMDFSGVVVESVIEMAHRLGLRTVAEGVETELQYEKIRDLGCDYIQGFYFSKPLNRDDFEKYMEQ